jgi:preprotein translocase subunit YajC
MIKVKVRATLLALMLPLLLNATYILQNDILKIEISKKIDEMGDELFSKTGIHGYVIATNEHFPIGFNLVEYSKKYEATMSKPYVLFIFAPQALRTKDIEDKGRVALIPSSDTLRSYYDEDDVFESVIGVVSQMDQNSNEDRHNVGVLQAFSELAEEIGASKGVELKTIIPNDTRNFATVLSIIIYIGTLFVLWIFFLRPLVMRIKNGKKAN